MKRRLCLLLAALLALAAVMPASAEVFSAPVDPAVAETGPAELWTEDIANAAEAAATAENDAAANGLNVAITSSNFPDMGFLLYVQESFDNDNDMYLSDSERNAVSVMAVYNKGLGSLEGIEYFPQLQELYCGSNQLKSLDLSGKAKLKKVWCMDNQLESLDVGGCTALEELSCYNNALESLDVSGCTALRSLSCYSCRLSILNINGCEALEYLDCSGNQLLMLDAEGRGELDFLTCKHNRLARLKIAGCAKLSYLACDDNQLANLDVTGCTNLIACIAQGEGGPSGDAYCYSYGDSDDSRIWVWLDPATEVTADGQLLHPLVPIGDCEIAPIADQAYTGKAKKPKPVVTYGGTTLERGVDYEVAYKNNTDIGKATVTVTGKGGFRGAKKATFKILPKKVAVSALTPGKGRLTVQWKKTAGAGYQLQYSLRKDFSSKKTVTIARTATVRKVLKGLKSGKTYYVRLRGYKKVNGKVYVSKWSKVKSAKVK